VPRLGSFLLLLALAGVLSAAAPATEPQSVVATVTGVVTADTLEVRLASGAAQRVRIAGVRAPTAGGCFAGEATAEARRLALGKRVRLLREGRGVYVTLPGGADLGRALVSGGHAQIDAWGRPFARFPAYVPVQLEAEAANLGMWGACAADVAVSMEVAKRAVVRDRLTYTVTIANRGPLVAPGVVLEVRPPVGVELLAGAAPGGRCLTTAGWLGTCTFAAIPANGTVTATFDAEAMQAGTASTRAIARLTACTRPACAAVPLHDSNLRNDETAALTTVLESAPAPGDSPGQASAGGCHPSYPSVCIPPPPPDLDCADIPYRDFAAPLDVRDADPHDFDGDEDGVGCQFNDY
jgi:uncharacterized repeat protein (TIGR01451 family)